MSEGSYKEESRENWMEDVELTIETFVCQILENDLLSLNRRCFVSGKNKSTMSDLIFLYIQHHKTRYLSRPFTAFVCHISREPFFFSASQMFIIIAQWRAVQDLAA